MEKSPERGRMIACAKAAKQGFVSAKVKDAGLRPALCVLRKKRAPEASNGRESALMRRSGHPVAAADRGDQR